MECVEPGYAEGFEWKAEVPSWRASAGAVGRQHGAGDVGALRLGLGAGGHSARADCHRSDGLPRHSESHDLPFTHDVQVHDDPFINEMDEISYWVYTKRAPCLMNYDNLIKKQHEAAQTAKLLNDKNLTEKVSTPKKKKRKLSMFDDDCSSLEKQQNIFFDSSQRKQRTVPSSCKSDKLESDIDFNIKNTSVQQKPKRVRKQKSSRTLHKKNKVVTSTPLRRSQRRIQNGTCNNTHLNISFDTYNCSYLNGMTDQSKCKLEVKGGQRSKKSLNKTPVAEANSEKKNSVLPSKSKNETAQKQQFDDLSDVSGFTANYIRSTKLHANTKPQRSLRSKNNRNLVKESQPSVQTDAKVPSRTTMLVCVNKAVNASPQLPDAEVGVLNCSTDSSQNVINLVTTKNNDRNDKVNKSTSLLKFVDVKTSKPKESLSCEKRDSKQISTGDLDISFQSKSTGNSRYPKRQKKNTEAVARSSNTLTRSSLDKRKKANKDVVEFNDSERKENPEDATVSRTRSGRSLTLALRQPENSLIVYSNSTEKVSTVNTLNVASQPSVPKNKAKLKRVSHMKKSMDTSDLALHRDSVRERSGFAACFSDSDDDSDALKQRKFFC